MATPRLALLTSCVGAMMLSGCVSVAGLQDWNYKRVNKIRAHEAWMECHTAEQRACLGRDFECGYKSGFVAAATGRDCQTPAVAPPKYWSTKYQSCGGQTCIQNWFAGYQAGVQAAESCGYSEFNEVPVSACAPTVNQTGCGVCYAPPACSCGGSCEACRRGFEPSVPPSWPLPATVPQTPPPPVSPPQPPAEELPPVSAYLEMPAGREAAAPEVVVPASVALVGPFDREMILGAQQPLPSQPR